MYIEKQRHRWMKYFNIPMMEAFPEGFPPFTLAAQRVLCAVSLQSQSKTIAVLDAFFRSFWVDGNGKIGQPEGFIPALAQVVGKEGVEELLKAVRLISFLLKTNEYL